MVEDANYNRLTRIARNTVRRERTDLKGGLSQKRVVARP